MSSANVDTPVQPTGHLGAQSTILEHDGNHPVSGPPKSGDLPNPRTTKREPNGDHMDWESWPAGRPGPFVSEGRIQHAMKYFQAFNRQRDERSRTVEKVFHVAEFSSTGREIFDGHVTEPELATRLAKPHPETSFRLLFASSRDSAIHLTYTRRVLSACGAPATVWTTLMDQTSSFHSFTNSGDGNTVFHGWMALRVPYLTIQLEDDTHLLSEPYLSLLTNKFVQTSSMVFAQKLYFSYNTWTQQTTIMTIGLNRLHICMIQHLKESSGISAWPEEMARLLVKYVTVVQECFTAIATTYDERANTPEMAARPLASGADHADRVRQADIDTRSASVTKSNVMAFQSAFASLEQYFQDLFRVTDLDPNIRQSVNALLTEQKMRHMATGHLVDNFVSRFDQHMNLLLNYTNIRMVEGMKSVFEENAKMTVEMKELAKQNAENTAQMKLSTEYNAAATKKMAELAELNQRQAAQGARQAQSMAVLAYDAKRDSEVMKAITVVTLIFFPATFVSTIFSMGFFKFDQDELAVSRQGWVYLTCTLPLTFVVLGVSFGWIWWTGRKEERPVAGQALAQAADTLRLGAVPRDAVV